MNYSVVPLPKEQWKGHPLLMDYETREYYDVSIYQALDIFKVTMQKKQIDEPIVHTSEEYDFPDSLYQAHWEKAEAFGVIQDDELIGAIEICPEEWSNRLHGDGAVGARKPPQKRHWQGFNGLRQATRDQ